MISYEYVPHNICTQLIKLVIDDSNDTVNSIYILGGCHGNLTAIMRMMKGKSVQECINCFQGIICGRRGTSCPDQIAKALELYVKGQCENGKRYEG